MLHTADEQKKMNLNLIKMQACMSVKLGIWRFVKHVRKKSQDKNPRIIPIILILKNVKSVLSVKGVIKKVQKVKPIPLQSNLLNIKDQEAFQKQEKFKELGKNTL